MWYFYTPHTVSLPANAVRAGLLNWENIAYFTFDGVGTWDAPQVDSTFVIFARAALEVPPNPKLIFRNCKLRLGKRTQITVKQFVPLWKCTC